VVSKVDKGQANHTLNQALRVLEASMDLALQKEDLDAMIAISDRLMMLYQHLSDKSIKKFKPGFTLIEKDQGENVSDESD
jgi:hypothetical protein